MIDLAYCHIIRFIHPHNMHTDVLATDDRQFGMVVNTFPTQTEDGDDVGFLHGMFFSYHDVKYIYNAINQGVRKTMVFLSDNDYSDMEGQCPPREEDPVILKRSDFYELVKLEIDDSDFIRVTFSIFGNEPQQIAKVQLNASSELLKSECSKIINDFEKYAEKVSNYQPRRIGFENTF
jgi:hypothetical protein